MQGLAVYESLTIICILKQHRKFVDSKYVHITPQPPWAVVLMFSFVVW